MQSDIGWLHFNYVNGNDTRLLSQLSLAHNQLLRLWGSVATDLNYVDFMAVNLRVLS